MKRNSKTKPIPDDAIVRFLGGKREEQELLKTICVEGHRTKGKSKPYQTPHDATVCFLKGNCKQKKLVTSIVE